MPIISNFPSGSLSDPKYGVCSTAAATVAKEATVDGEFTLKEGAFVIIKMTNSNTGSNPTLDINNTGAKPIMRYGTTVAGTGTTTSWMAGTIVPFIFDGTNWLIAGWLNTTYSNAGLGHGYGTCATAASTKEKAVTLSSYSLTANGYVAVKFSSDVPAGATMNINSKGAKAIYYKGVAIKDGVIKAGDVAYFIYSTYYHLLGIDRVAVEAASAEDVASAAKTALASGVTFSDGQTFQQKLDSGALKGADGQNGSNGKDGAAAGFGTPTASVDANTGTPSVTVTASGANTAKVFNFAFKNLKGAPGTNGTNGKTAYESAKSGGYTKTEAQFNSDLATVSDKVSSSEVQNLIQSAMSQGAKIQTGFYTGTGTYGKDNPCSITFDFSPQLVIVYTKNLGSLIGIQSTTGGNYDPYVIIAPRDATHAYHPGFNTAGTRRIMDDYFTWDENIFKWYSQYAVNDGSAEAQLNKLDTTYYYLGIG